jgi:hypothetical protein
MHTARIPSLGGAIEPLVYAPESVQSARVGGIGVVDDAILNCKRAHARPLAVVFGHVDSAHGCELGLRPLRCRLSACTPLQMLRPALMSDYRAPGQCILNALHDIRRGQFISKKARTAGGGINYSGANWQAWSAKG